MISIINYGLGNIGSTINMLKHIGIEAKSESDPIKLSQSEKIILPGVGSFDVAMKQINSIEGLKDVLNYKAKVEKVPILGICLGMQIMTRSSEEGEMKGLGWIKADTKKFKLGKDLKVMDAAAISLARENNVPVIVFSIHEIGAFSKVVSGDGKFTIIQ